MTEVPETRLLREASPVVAPDGSTVRPLCQIAGLGSFAHFELQPGAVARAVSHATVQEIWYVISGAGQMWRRRGAAEDIVDLRPDTCLTIPLGTAFQFRAEADQPLRVVAVTMPPWPVHSTHEARPERGPWTTTIGE